MTGFVVLPRRWAVERTLAWITRHRRCVRDYERLPAHHEATPLVPTGEPWSEIARQLLVDFLLIFATKIL